VSKKNPLQIIGVINAYSAMMAKEAGFKALYLSGAGVANASIGIPDVGDTTLEDVLIDVRRITSACDLPLFVDVDTAWEDDGGVKKTTEEMIKANAAGIQIEDQVPAKKCGHLEGKKLVSTEHMVDRIKEAVNTRGKNELMIMARTDAVNVEGLDSAIERASAYVEAGADAIFAEAVSELNDYEQFVKNLKVPVLANMTEFGKTPLFTIDELQSVGIEMVLYPLSGFRAMNAATMEVFKTIKEQGTQASVVESMQTREELYRILNYND